MKIAICDDEAYMRDAIENEVNLSHCLSAFNMKPEIFYFETGAKLVEWYDKGNYADVLFMDIEMDGMDGIEAAGQIRKRDKQVIIIFVSSHSEQVIDTFDCEAFNFLVKPIDHNRFCQVFIKVVEKYQAQNAFFTVDWKSEVIVLHIQDILYVERVGRHIIYHCSKQEYKTAGTLQKALERLEMYGFFQPHQGYIVNMWHIQRFASDEIIMSDGSHVMISVRKRQNTIKRYAEFMDALRR